MPPAAVLVGPMGAGKSTVGRLLAEILGVPFCDSDVEIEHRSGRTIAEIFAEDGEPAFRDLEAAVITDLLAAADGVLALGGGAVMTEATADALAGHPVVYLEVTAAAGFARVAAAGDRPLLATDDPAARYAELLASRHATYRSVARVIVDAERPPREVAADVRDALTPATGAGDDGTDESPGTHARPGTQQNRQ
ncbi:shikimate kinase [Gordonia shandongensis]|uniref:shikimate kinase n=1 Tax=Gordonia shandongensis TaxID=376351 RepID=UPI0004053735|nr:shikimate kinase [Gordonia shandongensis]